MAALSQEGDETATLCVGGCPDLHFPLCPVVCLRRLLTCNGTICWEIAISWRADVYKHYKMTR